MTLIEDNRGEKSLRDEAGNEGAVLRLVHELLERLQREVVEIPTTSRKVELANEIDQQPLRASHQVWKLILSILRTY